MSTNETTPDRGFWRGPTNETTPDRGFWGGPTNETTPDRVFFGGGGDRTGADRLWRPVFNLKKILRIIPFFFIRKQVVFEREDGKRAGVP